MPHHPIANPALPAPPTGKYPAKAHARRVARWISEHGGPSRHGLVFLQGQRTVMVEVRSEGGGGFLFILSFWFCWVRRLGESLVVMREFGVFGGGFLVWDSG
jgi:Xaa-Pro dipeptidase